MGVQLNTKDSSMITAKDLAISDLGPCSIDSPLKKLFEAEGHPCHFRSDEEKVIFYASMAKLQEAQKEGTEIPALELCGPRSKIFFDPAKTSCAIVTCGGLCPGINDVIRGIVMELYYRYGVKHIFGIPYGYQGFIPKYGHETIKLTPELVTDIHKTGGTILASSRGDQDSGAILDFLKSKGINVLFVIGGDGTLRGALDISEEAQKRKMNVSVVGVPKTVDNDILHVDQSFGFETAFAEAVKAISSANTEALGAPNGIGLVKLMGRHSGFIACFAALAMNDVNYVFIPEVPFELEGEKGFLNVLKERLKRRKHAVIIVAEGAGQNLIKHDKGEKDASGNVRLKDIGLYMKQRMNDYFKACKIEANIKYIDPTYIIRAVPASPQDSVYCLRLAQNAVHAAMSGKTKVVIGRRNEHYVHFPMTLMSEGRKRVNPYGDLWLSVLEATGQPAKFSD